MTLSAKFTSKSVFDQQGCRALTFALARLSCYRLLHLRLGQPKYTNELFRIAGEGLLTRQLSFLSQNKHYTSIKGTKQKLCTNEKPSFDFCLASLFSSITPGSAGPKSGLL